MPGALDIKILLKFEINCDPLRLKMNRYDSVVIFKVFNAFQFFTKHHIRFHACPCSQKRQIFAKKAGNVYV